MHPPKIIPEIFGIIPVMDIQYTAIVDALRQDIVSGRFRPGTLLPPVETLMRRFGAGEYSVRHALSELARDGALEIKPHVGARVTGTHLAKRKGRVVFVTVGRKHNFYDATFAERLGEKIKAAGWEFSDVVIEAVEEPDRDLTALEREISYGIDLALVNCLSQRVVNMLEERRVPYALTRGTGALQCRSAVTTFKEGPSSYANFTEELVRHMRMRKVRTVLEVDWKRSYEHAVTKAIHDAGFVMRRLWGECDRWKLCGMREVERMGMELVAGYFAQPKHRTNPPDLIVFMDDYLARGGLLALSAAGLRAPEDVKVIAQTNRNCEPVYFRRLTRFETDPEQKANITANWTIAWLSGKALPSTSFCGFRFIVGETL